MCPISTLDINSLFHKCKQLLSLFQDQNHALFDVNGKNYLEQQRKKLIVVFSIVTIRESSEAGHHVFTLLYYVRALACDENNLSHPRVAVSLIVRSSSCNNIKFVLYTLKCC